MLQWQVPSFSWLLAADAVRTDVPQLPVQLARWTRLVLRHQLLLAAHELRTVTATVGCLAALHASGTQVCEGTCVDIASDAANCGGCGNVCPTAEEIGGSCTNSECQCIEGEMATRARSFVVATGTVQ